jgi:hypothetical protein
LKINQGVLKYMETKRVITSDDVDNDPIIRAVRTKRDENEKLKADMYAYVNQVISEMNRAITWTLGSIMERIEDRNTLRPGKHCG